MYRHPVQVVERARKLASEGLTYRAIGKILNIDNSNISIWCRDTLENNPRKLIKKIQAKRESIKDSESQIFKKIVFDENTKKLACAIIYGCEGAKYPSSNCVSITNSDPNLMATFIKLFREIYNLDENKFRVHLQVHSNQNYKDLVAFWSKFLKISLNRFIKPTVTVAGGKKHRSDYQGTATIKYYDYRIQLQLIGVYEGFMRKSGLSGGVA